MPRSRLKVYLFLLAILLNIVYLAPVLDSPFLGDDLWTESSTKGAVLLSDTSLFGMCGNVEKEFIKSGRWYPLHPYYYLLFYHLNRYLYKAVVVAVIIVDVLLFAYFVRLLTSSDSAALMGAVLAPLFFQFRLYHDGILSYYCLIQLEFLFLLLSLIYLIRYLLDGKKLLFLLSLLSYVVCLLIYEVSYTFWVMHVLVAYLHFARKSLRKVVSVSWPFLGVAVANLGITFLIRAWFTNYYDGVSVNLGLSDCLTAFAKQLFAAVPLSSFLTPGTGHFFEYAVVYVKQDLVVIGALWALSWWLASDFALGEDQQRKTNSLVLLVWMGLALWIMPATIVSLSQKYQSELKWGLGYLPVYISSFGLIMIAVYISERWLCSAIARGRRSAVFVVLVATTLLGAIVCTATYNRNWAIVQKNNLVEHYPRTVVETALKGRLMEAVPDGSLLVCGLPLRGWDSPAFYRMHSGLSLQVVRAAGFPHDSHLGNSLVEDAFACWEVVGSSHYYDFRKGYDPNLCRMEAQLKRIKWPVLGRLITAAANQPRQAFFIRYEAVARELGYAVLGRMVGLKADNNSVYRVSSDVVRAYVTFPFDYSWWCTVAIAGTWTDSETFKATGSFKFTEKDLTQISGDAHGRLYELPLPPVGKLYDPRSIVATIIFTHR